MSRAPEHVRQRTLRAQKSHLPLVCARRGGKPRVAMGILACAPLAWPEMYLRFVLTFPTCESGTRNAASLPQPRRGPIFILIVCRRGGKGV